MDFKTKKVWKTFVFKLMSNVILGLHLNTISAYFLTPGQGSMPSNDCGDVINLQIRCSRHEDSTFCNKEY